VSGSRQLDDYLHRQARRDVTKGTAVAYVLVPASAHTQIVGYFTLAATAVSINDVPATVARSFPRYPHVPATLLGRLAVRLSSQKQGLGRYLLMAALERSLVASHDIASTGVVVDAKDEAAAAFYRRYDFLTLADNPLRLFLPMDTIRELFPQPQ